MHKTVPIWRDANCLLIDIEQVVRHFSRYYKYTLGSEIRLQAMKICRLINHAFRFKENKLETVQRLVMAVDDLKIQLQLAKELQVFRNFAEFERLSVLSVQVGKQSGGWLRNLQQAAQSEVSRNA